MPNSNKKKTFGGTLRYSLEDFILRVTALITFTSGFALLLTEVSWNFATILGLLLILIGLLLMGYLYYQRMPESISSKKHHQFPVFVIDSYAELKILDDKGKKAEYRKIKHYRVAIDLLSGYTETYLSADGHIVDINTGDAKCSTTPLPDGRLVVDVVFEKPLKKGEEYSMPFSCKYLDSFTKKNEYFSTHFVYPIEKYTLVVEFPPERPVNKAWLARVKMTGEREIINESEYVKIERDPHSGRTKIISVCYRPEVGSTQTLYWDW